MTTLLRWCLRLFLLVAGLALAAGVLLLSVLLLAAWALRSAWLRLQGRPAAPFVVRFGARDVFRRATRPPAGGEVIEVEARRLS